MSDALERYYAEMEAARNAAEDAFFAARPTVDTPGDRAVFRAGFERAYKLELPVAQEPKYTVRGGRIVNRATGIAIPDDEPLFILRAKDREAVYAIMGYRSRCLGNADHYRAIDGRVEDFLRFKEAHPERMKEPDTAQAQCRGWVEDPSNPSLCINCGEDVQEHRGRR
jgi:hypothetical protein